MLSSRRSITAVRAKFHAGELRSRVLLPRRVDRAPVEVASPGNIFGGALATASPHVAANALGMEEGVARLKVEPLALHPASARAHYAARPDPQRDTRVAKRKIANAHESQSGHVCSLALPTAFSKAHLISQLPRSQAFYGGLKWFC